MRDTISLGQRGPWTDRWGAPFGLPVHLGPRWLWTTNFFPNFMFVEQQSLVIKKAKFLR